MPRTKRSARPAKARARSPARKASPRRAKARPLERYRQKRDFAVTPEPPPEAKPWAGEGETLFVVQKHAATRLHYDFRLAHRGVLWSWAVTRGPSLSTQDRRLAVHVEDHPLDYARFEGIIPKGQYGGGTVMVWDIGTWTPLEDPDKTYKQGRLSFELHGRKLRGRWSLVRMHGRGDEKRENWLLIKRTDEHVRDDGESVLAEDRSVLTGRSLEEIAEDPGAVWHSNREPDAPRQALPTAAPRTRPAKRAGASSLPPFVAPQLATLVDRVPEGGDWVHEVKLDGYRVYCRLQSGKARFLTRKGLDWTDKFGTLAYRIDLPAESAAIDGEIVTLDKNGVSDFGGLQLALTERRSDDLVFFAFDLLHLDGEDLRGLPLVERKSRLKALFERRGETGGQCFYSEHFATGGDELYQSACRMSLEGIISKRAEAPYTSGRGTDWVKIKCRQRQEFVIGGFTERRDGPGGIGALLVGYYDGGRLLYAGKVGTGFTAATHRMVRRTLDPKRTATSPFRSAVPRMRDLTWVKPDIVCEVEFHNWTRDGLLRQASFAGLRFDKKAAEIVREAPLPTPEVEQPMSPARPAAAAKSRAKPASRSRPKPRPSDKVAAKPATAPGDPLARLTHPDKVLFKAQGLTKRDLAQYYLDIADTVLPHLAGRLLALVRCPEGQGKECFFQKHPAMGMSPAIHRVPVKMKSSTETYLMIEDVAGLVELVQFGTLEIHPWGSMGNDIERPDRIIFDLDPDPSVPWARVVEAAHEVKALLEEIGLRSFPKTTGGKGLHVVVPVKPGPQWPEVKEFARTIAETLVARSPDQYTANMAKRKRTGKIYVDFQRNDRGATAIAPYSTRARDGAPVAVPLAWREVAPDLDPKTFTIHTVRQRLKRLKEDPWAEMLSLKQPIDKLVDAMKR